MSARLRVVVLGMMGRCPFGGQTWLYLNWLRGLARLGHEVWYVEDDATWPYDPRADAIVDDPAYAAAYLERVLARIGLEGRWAYRALYRGPDACFGLSRERLVELYRDCDVLLNVCGATVLNEDHLRARLRVYVETDPVTNQLELASGKQKTRDVLDAHHLVVTYGENYGGAGLRRADGRPPLPPDPPARRPRPLADGVRRRLPSATPRSATGGRRGTTSSGRARPTPGASTTSS